VSDSLLKRRIFSSKATLWLLVTAIPLFIYSNCSSSHDSLAINSEADRTAILNYLQVEKTAVLSSKCATCHNETSPTRLKDVLNTQYLIDNGFIRAGSPQTSTLYLRIIDGFMPPAGSPDVSDDELAILRDWIAAEGGNYDTYIGGGTGSVAFTPVRSILRQHCANCHSAGGSAPRLDNVDASTLRGSGLVVPNSATGSPLFQSLQRMPPGGALGQNSDEGNTIRAWINGGAL
jgi:uncharacterized membrane protein